MSKRRGSRKAPISSFRRQPGVALAARPPASLAPRETPPTDELGTTGDVSWGYAGITRGTGREYVIDDTGIDYASPWQMPTNRWATVDKMKTDPLVQASLSALTFPVLAAALKFEPASDDPEDVWLAEFVARGMDNMTTALVRHRMETLGGVGEGVKLFETEYEQREDGYWYPRKLAIRPNKTVVYWHTDTTGGPAGVTQSTILGAQVRIEMDRLLAFTHLGDGPSLLGRPAMRAMYRPWLILDGLHRTGSIALERHGVGIPWARYTGSSQGEQVRVDRALMDLHANERLFFRMGADVPDWGIKGVEGTVMDPVPFMEYQRRDLFLATMAQFLALGSDGVGSLALSGDHSGFFMLAVRFIAAEVEDTYNRYLIPRWLGFNWTLPADRLPKAKHALIDQRSITDFAQAVAQLVQAGVPLPMDEVARESGRLLGVTVPEPEDLPAPDVEDVNAPNAPEAGTNPAAGGPARLRPVWPGVTLAAADGRLVSEVKLEALGIAPRFVEMSAALDKGRGRIIARVEALQAKQAYRLAGIGVRLIKAGDAQAVADALTGARVDLAAPARPKRLVSYDEEAAAFEDELYDLYDQGAGEGYDELEQQGVAPARPDADRRNHDRERLAALALIAGALLADRMTNAWAADVLRQMGGPADKAALLATTTGSSSKLLASLAGQRVNEALAAGRAATGDANVDSIDHYIFTAVMDPRTCSVCADWDGLEFEPGREPSVPLYECEGGSNCRCQLVAIGKGEAGPGGEGSGRRE